MPSDLDHDRPRPVPWQKVEAIHRDARQLRSEALWAMVATVARAARRLLRGARTPRCELSPHPRPRAALVRIDLADRGPDDHRRVRAIADGVHRAMAECFGTADGARLQLVTRHRQGELVYDRHLGGLARTGDLVVIEVVLAGARPAAARRAFFGRIASILHEDPGLRPEDLVVRLQEVPDGSWFLGRAA